ncbi:hypothetical protein BCAR13_520224 [Paraburkholderia caribensis]|nr:hypothetical protein BCAR13_520224 [Paraburkholderia caribensis]
MPLEKAMGLSIQLRPLAHMTEWVDALPVGARYKARPKP